MSSTQITALINEIEKENLDFFLIFLPFFVARKGQSPEKTKTKYKLNEAKTLPLGFRKNMPELQR